MSQEIKSGMLSFLRKENIVAPIDYNRWRIPPASIAIHLCIGSVYAWSVFNPPSPGNLVLLRHLQEIGRFPLLCGFFRLRSFALALLLH